MPSFSRTARLDDDFRAAPAMSVKNDARVFPLGGA